MYEHSVFEYAGAIGVGIIVLSFTCLILAQLGGFIWSWVDESPQGKNAYFNLFRNSDDEEIWVRWDETAHRDNFWRWYHKAGKDATSISKARSMCRQAGVIGQVCSDTRPNDDDNEAARRFLLFSLVAALVPIAIVLAFTLWQIVLVGLTLYFVAQTARFSRRTAKKLTAHVNDAEAHAMKSKS